MPNHVLEQFSSELLTLYPAANLLVASKEDFERERRQTLMPPNRPPGTGMPSSSRILASSAFLSAYAPRKAFFTEQIEGARNAITEQQREDRGSPNREGTGEAEETVWKPKLGNCSPEGTQDAGLTFEQLGVDRLFVDEAAHHFKNLFTSRR